MPNTEATNTFSIYREGAKWLVSLAGAAVGGAFTQYEKVLPLPLWLKVLFFAAVLAFLLVVIAGVYQYYWFLYMSNQEERVKDLRPEQKQPQEQISSAEKRDPSDSPAPREIKILHRVLMYSFLIGVVFTAILSFAVFRSTQSSPTTSGICALYIKNGCKENKADAQEFTIALSAVHKTGHGKEAHTFLLNRTTGELWQMVCKAPGQVEFRRIHKIGFNGAPEDNNSVGNLLKMQP